MTHVTCIAGLPGSGKTHLGRQLASELGGILVDDIRDLSQLPVSGSVNDLVVTDPNFCIASVRANASKMLTARYGEVRWIFFANDPDSCRKLVQFRDDGRQVDQLITQLSKRYEIPPGADVREIWQPSKIVVDNV